MSWDVLIKDSDGQSAQVDYQNLPIGGTYLAGCEPEEQVDARLNVTYNYSPYYRMLWEDGFKRLDGKPLDEAIPLLESAVWALGTDRDANYWKATQGNAGGALYDLLKLCREVESPHLYKLEVV